MQFHILFRARVFVLETNEHSNEVENLVVGFAVDKVDRHNVVGAASHVFSFSVDEIDINKEGKNVNPSFRIKQQTAFSPYARRTCNAYRQQR